MRESPDSPLIASSDWGMLSVGIIVIRAIVITVPFLAPFALSMVSFLMPILDPATCISIVGDVTQVLFVLTLITLL
jgi:hypothetical protein